MAYLVMCWNPITSMAHHTITNMMRKSTHTNLAQFRATVVRCKCIESCDISCVLMGSMYNERKCCKIMIGSYQWPDNRTNERRSSITAFYCTNAHASQKRGIYIARFVSLQLKWLNAREDTAQEAKTTAKIKVNCGLKQICLYS